MNTTTLPAEYRIKIRKRDGHWQIGHIFWSPQLYKTHADAIRAADTWIAFRDSTAGVVQP